MNCEQNRQYYLQLQIEEADINNQQAFDEHMSTCNACQAFVSSDEKFVRALKDYPTEPSSKRLLNNAMKQIATEQKLKRSQVANIGFGLALAASLFMAFIMPGQFNLMGISGNDPLATITMSMNSQRTINIVFNSPEAVNDAVIFLSLPDNIRIAGYENKTEIQWKTKLNAGENTLKLPLVASNTGTGILQSTLKINGKSKKITLLVDVSSEEISTSIINTATT